MAKPHRSAVRAASVTRKVQATRTLPTERCSRLVNELLHTDAINSYRPVETGPHPDRPMATWNPPEPEAPAGFNPPPDLAPLGFVDPPAPRSAALVSIALIASLIAGVAIGKVL